MIYSATLRTGSALQNSSVLFREAVDTQQKRVLVRQSRKYLDPVLLSKLANMNLVAKCAVEGFFSGLHPSPFHGFSVEYSDHRDYHPGDELKFLDWKMFGRSDK